MAIKESGKISECFYKKNPIDLIPDIQVLGHSSEISHTTINLIKQFNLLPNDALILATCQHYEIKNIATFDSDFEKPCNSLGIRIFDGADDLESLD